MKQSAFVYLLAVMLAVILTLSATVACQSGSGGDQPLKIGHLTPNTGVMSDFGESQNNAVSLAAKHILAAGGPEIVLTTVDNQSNSEIGNNALQRLKDVDKVAAAVGSIEGTSTTPPKKNVSVPGGSGAYSTDKNRYNGLAVAGQGVYSVPGEQKDADFLFLTTFSSSGQAVILAKLARELGYKTAAMMYINNSYGRGMSYEFKRTFEVNGGKIVGFSTYKADKTSFTSELTNAVVNNPEVLVAIGYPVQAKIFLREVQEGGYIGKLLFMDGFRSSKLFETVGWEYFEGMYGTSHGFNETSARQIFKSDYESEFSKPAENPFLAETYDSVVLIALASIKAGTTTDRAKIRDALALVSTPPGEIVGPGVDSIKKAIELIKQGQEVEYQGASESELDKNKIENTISPIEIWQIKGSKIVPTGRLEFP